MECPVCSNNLEKNTCLSCGYSFVVRSVEQAMLDLIQIAVDLGNSLQDDILEQRSISDETIRLLSRFRHEHDELDNLLDVKNGVN